MSKRKKILIVSRAFYPNNSPRSFRTTELAKEFSKQGHDVTVLLPKGEFDYSAFQKTHQIKLEFYELRLKSFSRSGRFGEVKRKAGRILFLLTHYPEIEMLWSLRRKLGAYHNFDLLISIAFPHPVHWATAFAQGKTKNIAKTWVADCGDPFMGNKLESIKPPIYFSYFEKLFCRRADFISVPTANSKAAYYPEFLSKFRVIPQGFDFSNSKFTENPTKNEVPNFAYAGGIAGSGIRDPKKILNYLLKQEKKFIFHIFSRNSETLNSLASNSQGQIILHGSIPRIELLHRLHKMDFLLNLDNGIPDQTPSKLIDYTLVKRPILNISAQNPEFALLDQFLAGDYSNQFKISDINDYDIRNVAAKFLELTAP